MKKEMSARQASHPIIVTFLIFLIFQSCQKKIEPNSEGMASGIAVKDKTNSTAMLIGSAVATDWYKLQSRFFLAANPASNGTLNAEAFAYIGIALYEAVRPGIKNSVSLSTLLYQMPAMPDAANLGLDFTVTANAALASMVRKMYPWLTPANKSSVDSLENAYNNSVSLSKESEKFNRSQSFGRAIAQAVYNWSTTDNFNVGNSGYIVPVGPGLWVPTSAAPLPVNPFVSFSRPLLQEHGGNSFIVPPPLAFSTAPSSEFYQMVKQVYDVSKILTTEQRNMALFWNDQGVGVGFTPQAHMMNVVTEAIEQTGADLGTAAQTYAKAGIAIRDAQLVLFRSKYVYNLIRPISYIRSYIDPTWNTVIPTPNHPEYPSAHGYITSATVRAAAWVLGNDITVVDSTYKFRGTGYEPRTFSSLDAVGYESGISRLYAGIHYLPSINVGIDYGRMLGDRVGRLKLVN